ncbi:sugar transferase [Actinotalea sp. AC32]|nr:sugar transferase [Actinotalea sp. AC32]
MTLAVDREAVLDGQDRRARAVEPRRSWASAQPFETRQTPHNVPHAVRRWADVAVGYRLRVLLTDAAVATGVAGALLPGLYGVTPRTVGLVVATALGFCLLVMVGKGYDLRHLGDGPTEFQALLRAGAGSAVLLMAGSYSIKAEIPRTLVFVGVPLIALLAFAARYALRKVLHRARVEGDCMKRTVVVGDPAAVGRVVADLAREPYHGYHVTGVCLPGVDDDAVQPDVPVVGAIADVPQVVADRAVEVVVVAGSPLSGEALRRLSWALDRAGAQLVVAPDLQEVTSPRLSVRPAAGLSLLEVEVGAPRGRMVGKTLVDRTLGTMFLLAAALPLGVAALLVRLTSPGPAFYTQTRVGVDGVPFTLYKLRSMYVDADARRARLADQDEGAGVLFKMKHDPRVTPVGRVLRRFSIDELPQLFNVVRGDMSLVGPRPPLLEEVARYEDPVQRRLRVKPGLTGLWQVSGRSDLSWEESVRLDLRYVDNWSLAMDLMILWKTARAVVTGSGAY